MSFYEIAFFGILLNLASGDKENYFKVSPSDVELKDDGSPVIIRCELTHSLESCEWLKGGNKLEMEHGRYELRGDRSIGECDLLIIRPQIGVDTTFWQCTPLLSNYDRLISNPARVVARNGTGKWDSSPYNLQFGVIKGQYPLKRKITLDGKFGAITRVRWFMNGKLASSINTDVSKIDDKFAHVSSSIAVTSFPNSEPLMIHCCVEVQSEALLKIVFVGAIYVIDDNYDVETAKPLTTLPYTITPPKLRLSWTHDDNTRYINDNRVILRTKDFKENKFSVTCTDDAAATTTYLRWGLVDPNGNADVIDRNIEFDDNEINGPESIGVNVRFLYPNRHITLQCQAGDVVHAGISRTVSTVITVRVEDACFNSEKIDNHKAKNDASSIVNFYSTLMIISSCQLFCHLSPF